MLIHELSRQGDWLFRRRSFLPLLLLAPVVLETATHPVRWNSSGWKLFYEAGCFLIALAGLVVRGIALGYAQPNTSGRNTIRQIADHLNTTGLYSVCRHPLYLGNILIMLGVLLFAKSLLLAVVGLLAYVLFYERIIAAEERFLEEKFGDRFRAWAAQTPAFIPRLHSWKRPQSPFSWRAAVLGEFYGLTAIVGSLFFLKSLEIFSAERRIRLDPFWSAAFAAALILFVVLRFIRKHT